MNSSKSEDSSADAPTAPVPTEAGRKGLFLLIAAVLLAVFLGALDALLVGAAMPTIVADLGGLHLYGWVFSSYLLARAIALPIFGKLCDLVSSRKLYVAAIAIFTISSVLCGASTDMRLFIVFRAFQGIGAGGTFALAYIVVSDLYAPEKRAKMMGLISVVWGIASILGPALGGFIVTYFSWRWAFYINLPLGGLALLWVARYLEDTREKKKGASVDYAGAVTLSVAVLAMLFALMLGGRSYPWTSPEILALAFLTVAGTYGFYRAEKRASEPMLALDFFRISAFRTANGSAFFSSFAVFSLSAFSPLYIQGALGKTPAQLGLAMVPFSLAWSIGAFCAGRIVNRRNEKVLSIIGSIMMVVSSILLINCTTATPLAACSATLALSALGMGVISLTTLLVVQNSAGQADLGVATSSQAFARTLGGTIGVGISGSFVTTRLVDALDALSKSPLGGEIPASLAARITESAESLFQPEVRDLLSPDVLKSLQEAVGSGVETVFWVTLAVTVISLLFSFFLPGPAAPSVENGKRPVSEPGTSPDTGN